MNTHSFTKEEIEIMSIELNKKFGLKTSVRSNKSKYIIIIEPESFKLFLKITSDFLIPSMKYKLPK